MPLKSSEVFGLNTEVSDYSYIDRGNLDAHISLLSGRDQHISLKGESKSGKSWLRQKAFPEGIVVQCRIGFTPLDVFTAVLADLGIQLRTSQGTSKSGHLELSGTGEFGWKLLARAEASISGGGEVRSATEHTPVGKDENDLQFICEIIRNAGRKVIIEDFHYLSTDAQRDLAHDLKAMWDFGVYLVIVGVWVKRNYLTYLNPDLAGRITEVSIYWGVDDLTAVLDKGCDNLNVEISTRIRSRIIQDSFGNVGLLQSLTLGTLDQSKISVQQPELQKCLDHKAYEDAALGYAEQLEAVYLEFARRVSQGIRKRKGSTKIYAHAMWAIFESSDHELINGVPVDEIYNRASSRQPRVQKGNLKAIMGKIDSLQIDDRGKGLVVTFVEQSNSVAVVDRTVLFYRKYCTVEWPWKEIIENVEEEGLGAEGY